MTGTIIHLGDGVHEVSLVSVCSCCGCDMAAPAPSWCDDHHVAPYVPPISVLGLRHVTADTLSPADVEQVRNYVRRIPVSMRTATEHNLLAACDDAARGVRTAGVAVALAWNTLLGAP